MIKIKVNTSVDNHNITMSLNGELVDIIEEMAAANVAFVNRIKASGCIKDETTKDQILFTVFGVVMKMFNKDGQKELARKDDGGKNVK